MSNRDAFVDLMKARMDEWNAEIDVLEARARKTEASARVQGEEALKRLRERRDEFRARLEDLRKSGEGAWEDLRSGVSSAADSLRKALEQAGSHFA